MHTDIHSHTQHTCAYKLQEGYPGPSIQEDADIDDFIRRSTCSGNALVGTCRSVCVRVCVPTCMLFVCLGVYVIVWACVQRAHVCVCVCVCVCVEDAPVHVW
jgi:hypothetical protein